MPSGSACYLQSFHGHIMNLLAKDPGFYLDAMYSLGAKEDDSRNQPTTAQLS